MIPIGQGGERRGRQPLDLELGLTVLILRLIKAGWDAVCRDGHVDSGCDEREMTEVLLEGMRSHLDSRRGSANGDSVEWRDNITVARGTEVAPGRGHSGVRGIPDIAVYFHDIRVRRNDHDPHAVVECKRVSGSRLRLCQLYVFRGIDRFVSGKYAGHHSVGFMIGYLLEGSVSMAVDGINAYLSNGLRPSEVLIPFDSQCLDSVHISRHARPMLSTPVVIHHTFLRVPS